jgi:hypothetical protein
VQWKWVLLPCFAYGLSLQMHLCCNQPDTRTAVMTTMMEWLQVMSPGATSRHHPSLQTKVRSMSDQATP